MFGVILHLGIQSADGGMPLLELFEDECDPIHRLQLLAGDGDQSIRKRRRVINILQHLCKYFQAVGPRYCIQD